MWVVIGTFGRFGRCPTFSRSSATGNGRGFMALEQYPGSRRARVRNVAQCGGDEARRRADVDHRHLRSRSESALLGAPAIRIRCWPVADRKGDSSTCSIVAVNPDTGKLNPGVSSLPRTTRTTGMRSRLRVLFDALISGDKPRRAAGAGQPQRIFFPAGSRDRGSPC